MTLEHCWLLLIKRWKLIVACIVIVGGGTYLGSRLITPIYQSTVLVRVAIHTVSNTADYNGLLASDQLVQTEALLATSDPVLRDVVTRHPGLTVDQLSKMTTTAPRLNTQIFEIDVHYANPKVAADLANDVAATLIKQQVQENQQDNRRSQQQFQHEVDTTHQRMDAIQTKITTLQQQIANLQFQKGTQIQITGLQVQIAGLQNQLNGLQDHYTQWQTTLLQLETVEAQNNNFLRIAQPAYPAKDPVKPQLFLNTAAGLATGLLLGLLLALLFEQLDTRVRTPEDLVQLLNWPILGVIWRGESVKGKQEDLVNLNKRGINVEPYRILRTNIGFSAVNKPIRMLMVTSAMPSEGKSTVAANLAIFMAKAGKSTLLIDADLRHPTVQQKFGIAPTKKGLSNALVTIAQIQSVVNNRSDMQDLEHGLLQKNIFSTDIPNLYIMTAGPLPPNPPEMLESKALDDLLEMIAHSGIDQVIFDTSPLVGLSDTSILMSKVDSVLLVVDITRAKRKMLKYVKEILTRTNAHVLGCVINKQHSSRGDIPYYYFQGIEEENVSHNGHSPVFASSSISPSEQEFGPDR